MTKNSIRKLFEDRCAFELGKNYVLDWDADEMGVVCGWCKLFNSADIKKAAQFVADLKGRVMAITPMIIEKKNEANQFEIAYHFFFGGIDCTVSVLLSEESREIQSITPLLKSADWHEREMQEFFNIKVWGHPNPKKLFLDKNSHLDENTMVPLSTAMNGSSSATLWEKVLKSKNKGEGQ